MLLPTKGILLLLLLTLLEWSNNFTQILTVLCILQHKLLLISPLSHHCNIVFFFSIFLGLDTP